MSDPNAAGRRIDSL